MDGGDEDELIMCDVCNDVVYNSLWQGMSPLLSKLRCRAIIIVLGLLWPV